MVARDGKNNPLFSEFDWTEEATARILRVPVGFMRDRTQERIEGLAREQGSPQIDLPCVEAGVQLGLQIMAEMTAQQGAAADPERREEDAPAPQCPAARTSGLETSDREQPLNEVTPLNELAAMRMLLNGQEESREK